MAEIKYLITDTKDSKLTTQIVLESTVPITYIDILKQTSGKIDTLELTKNDELLIEKYLEFMPGPKIPLEYLMGNMGIEDIDTPERFQMSELPMRAVKRKGYVTGARVSTFQVDNNEIYTLVNYSVIDELAAEIEPIIINDFLTVPELAKISSSFDEALRNHEQYKSKTLKILRNL